MNRGTIHFTLEHIKQLFGKEILPDDFELSGAEYNYKNNTLVLYGYSDRFKPVCECAEPEDINQVIP